MSTPPLSRDLRAWAHAPLNALTEAVAERRAAGIDVIDLVGAGAYENGLGYPNDRLQAMAAAAAARSAAYRPHPRGQHEAREAVAQFYARRGVATSPQQIVLTPGTSVAYLYVLRLLFNAGDEVLVPSPGYPLFDDLCVFAGVRQRYYHLRQADGRWQLDLDDLAFQCTPRTRAIMVVSPHNPLGLVLSADDLRAVSEICERHRLALVFDEVFSELVAGGPIARPEGAPLTVILNGMSKMLSLPGLKIGWMRIAPTDADFLDALEYASDLFLPVSELAQAMVAPLLDTADDVSRGFADEIRRRRALVEAALPTPPVAADGGVYVCLPVEHDEDALALRALEAGVLVHPGHFYDLPGHLVFTCVPSPSRLEEGLRRLRPLL